MLCIPCKLLRVNTLLIQGLGVSLFIFSLANHTAGVPTVITHPEFNHDIVSSAGLRYCSAMSGEEDLMWQVEDLKEKIGEAEGGKEEMGRGREGVRGKEEARGREYMMRGSGAGGLASRAMGFAVHVEQQDTEKNDRQFYFPSGHLNTRPPRFPTDPAKVPAWRHGMMLFLNFQGLGYTVKQSINSVNIISED